MRYALNIVVNRPLVFFIFGNKDVNNDILYVLTKSPAFPLLVAFKDSHYVPVLRESVFRSSFRNLQSML